MVLRSTNVSVSQQVRIFVKISPITAFCLRSALLCSALFPLASAALLSIFGLDLNLVSLSDNSSTLHKFSENSRKCNLNSLFD